MTVAIHIDIPRQELLVLDGEAGETLLARYPISTALNGPGETHGSGCTPRGLHRVRAKVGSRLPARHGAGGPPPHGRDVFARISHHPPGPRLDSEPNPVADRL